MRKPYDLLQIRKLSRNPKPPRPSQFGEGKGFRALGVQGFRGFGVQGFRGLGVQARGLGV